MDSKVTANKLKERLWEALEGLKDGNIKPDEALAVSGLGKAIVHVANVQCKISQLSGRPLPTEVIDFSESNK